MSSFRDVAAKNAAGKLFDLTEGREKVDIKDIITDYPDGITVTGFTTLLNKKKETISAFTFKEDNKAFFFGGTVLTGLAEEWVKPYNGDFEAGSKALQEEGGCKIKLFRKTTKTGNECTAYEVV